MSNARKVTRQWLGVESSAYALAIARLMTAAWINGNVSAGALVSAWILGGLTLKFSFHTLYRGHAHGAVDQI